MSDLEPRLRDELRHLADHAPFPTEMPADVLRRVRRRRRVRAASGVAACAALLVVVGIVGAGLAGTDTPDDSQIVVAAPGDEPLELGDPAELELEVEALPESPLAARADHSGVWTGTEFVVWGGFSGNKVDGGTFADGAAYDPAAGTWRTLAPSPLGPRARHAAVWTGTEMVVWGGAAEKFGVGGLLDGAAYDPASDRWRPIAPAPEGFDRSHARAVMFDGLAVFAGGSDPRQPASSSVLAYDPAADTWTEHTAPFPVFAMAVVEDDLVLAGTDVYDNGIEFATFDPRSGSHDALPPFPAEGTADWVGLTSTGSHLVASVAFLDDSTVAVLDRTLGEWTAESTVDAGRFTPGVGVSMPFAPGLNAWTGRWFLAWSPAGLQAVAPGTSETARPSEDTPCNSNGVAVWTGGAVLQWGGDACRADAPAPQVADGVEVTPAGG